MNYRRPDFGGGFTGPRTITLERETDDGTDEVVVTFRIEIDTARADITGATVRDREVRLDAHEIREAHRAAAYMLDNPHDDGERAAW